MKLYVDKAEVGKRIREYRNSKHLTIEELAYKIAVTKTPISRYENGEIMPSDEKLDAMAQVFDVDPFELKYGVSLHFLENKTIDALVIQRLEEISIEIPSVKGVFRLAYQKE